MKLEDEKKLVAEWMGWNLKYIEDRFDWNPQSERKWWDELFDKIWEQSLDGKYISELVKMGNFRKWSIHTAKPEVCWKALIKTLEQS